MKAKTLRRTFLILALFVLTTYISYFFLSLYTSIEEPYPFLLLPGFGGSPEYAQRIHKSRVYILQRGSIKDSMQLKEIFGRIPENSWSYIIKNNFTGKNPRTKKWFLEKFSIKNFDSALYMTDSCTLSQNQVQCFRKDTVILLK